MQKTLVVAMLGTALMAASASAQEGSLVASGTGSVQLTPDAATISIAIETRADEASAAGARNAEKAAAVRDAIVAVGVDAEAVTTAHYNVRQNWKRGNGDRVPDGYVADMTLRVDLADLDLAGKVIDAGLAAGANRVDGVSFRSSRADEARREALALAVQDARMSAETMAVAAGGSLGSLVELSTEGVVRPVGQMRALRAEAAYADAATEIQPGELTVTARVTGRWRFVE